MKYEITDPKQLQAAHPHLFKSVPDHKKVRAAIVAGFDLPGVSVQHGEAENAGDELRDTPDFARTTGGGGASTGIRMALGREPDVAINHDPEAIAMHEANHPHTEHYCQSIYQVDPDDIIRKYQRRVGLAWFSPDCTHHSKARGGKPKQKHIRDLAWVVVHWAERAVYQGERPRVIAVENVEEFKDWGPLDADGKACLLQKGEEFQRWVKALRKLGYKVEWRELRAHDYGAPTIRKRLFVIARCDGNPIVWPKPTHGKPGSGLMPYRTAAECIDWSIPCPSIFLTKEQGKAIRAKRPLADATMRRIAHGIGKFVLNSAEPFIVNLTHHGAERLESLSEPFRTITGANRGEKALAVPYLAGVGGRAGQSPERGIDKPYHTTTSKADTALLTPFLARTAHGDVDKNGKRRGKGQHPVDDPLGTITASRDYAIATPFITKFRKGSIGSNIADPLHTVTAGGECKRPAGAAHAMGMVLPTLIQTGYGERPGQAPRVPGLDKPLGTAVGGVKHAVVAASVCRHFGESIGSGADEPIGTATGQNKSSLLTAFLAQHNNHRGVDVNSGHSLEKPISTITGTPQQSLVTGNLVKLRGTCNHGQHVDEPAATISAQGQHLGLVAGSLMKYYGTDQAPELDAPLHTVTSKDRFGLFTSDIAPEPLSDDQLARARQVADLLRQYGQWDEREFVTLELDGSTWIIVDIGLRMLTPPELFAAQGFPGDYVIAPMVNGKPLSKTAQVRMCGNSVSPFPCAALVHANFFNSDEDEAFEIPSPAFLLHRANNHSGVFA